MNCKFKLKIVDKFIFNSVFQATFVCLFLFIIVWIAPETLVRIIRQIFLEGLSAQGAVMALFYELPKVLAKALPVSILLGSLFTFDKLSKDSELAILRGIGLSFTRIMAPVLVLGAMLSIACFYVGDRLVPMASNAVQEDAGYNEHFVYIQKDAHSRPKQGVIVSNFTPAGIKNLIIINFAPNEYDDVVSFKEILFAPYALKFNDKWVLPTAKEYNIDKNGIFEEVKTVQNYPIIEGTDAEDVYLLMLNGTKRERGFTNSQMHKYIKLLKKQDFEDEHNYMLAKFYQRYLHPISCILFAMIGCLLGFAPPRSVRLVGFTVAVGLVFLYYITLPFFDLLAEKGALLPFLSAIAPIAGFIFAIYVIKKVKDL